MIPIQIERWGGKEKKRYKSFPAKFKYVLLFVNSKYCQISIINTNKINIQEIRGLFIYAVCFILTIKKSIFKFYSWKCGEKNWFRCNLKALLNSGSAGFTFGLPSGLDAKTLYVYVCTQAELHCPGSSAEPSISPTGQPGQVGGCAALLLQRFSQITLPKHCCEHHGGALLPKTLRGWWGPGTGCPGKLEMAQPWKGWRAGWMGPEQHNPVSGIPAPWNELVFEVPSNSNCSVTL